MPTVKDFLTTLLTKAGAKLDDEQVVQALATAELATIQIPDALVTPIDNGLLSVKDAKNNHTEVRGHYFKMFADGIDKQIERLIEEGKLPDDAKTAILSEESTAKRITALTGKIRDIEAAKAKAGGADKEALNQEITRLNNELRTEKEKEGKLKSEHQEEIKKVRMSHALGGMLGSYKTKFDELPANVKENTLTAIINNSLAADAAEFSVDDAGQIILRKKDGTNFFGEDNRLLEPKSYLDKIFARDKILIVNDPNQNNNSGGGANTHNRNNGQNYNRQIQNQINNGSGNSGNRNNAANPVTSLVDEALAAFNSNGQ